jgi:hypothetical protein
LDPVTTVGLVGVVDCAATVPMDRARLVKVTATLDMREMFLTMIRSLALDSAAGKVGVRRLDLYE